MTDLPTDPVLDMAGLFMPRVVAVAGVSSGGGGQGNRYISNLHQYGYDGEIVVIHPSRTEVSGLPAYPSLGAIPRPVDFAYIAVPAPAVPPLLAGAGGKVRYALVMSSGFGETREGVGLERDLVTAARQGRVRVIGPNCLGIYCPAGRVTFIEKSPEESGTVGVISQSGGLGVDLIRRGKNRGIRFSKLVTIGNSADLDAADFVRFLRRDPATAVIGLYLEGVRDGRPLFDALCECRGSKPVVLLKGGRTELGQRAAASHTGAMLSDDRIWEALAVQCGAVLVESLDEFLDSLLALQTLTPLDHGPSRQVVLFGNGGGTSVLASDALARGGFELARIDGARRTALEELSLPPGSSIENPIDTPAGTLIVREGRVVEDILDAAVAPPHNGALVAHVNLPVMEAVGPVGVEAVDRLIARLAAYSAEARGRLHVIVVLRSDGDPETEALRRRMAAAAVAARIPVYPEVGDAVRGLQAIYRFEEAALKRQTRALIAGRQVQHQAATTPR